MNALEELSGHFEATIDEQVLWWKEHHFGPKGAIESLGFNHMAERYNYLDWPEVRKITQTTYIELMLSVAR